MGFHTCGFCGNETSSGDVILKFDNGRTWTMPDMILHYIAEHDYRPDHMFVEDVAMGELVGGEREQTKGADEPRKVGYLSAGDFDVWGAKDIATKGMFFMRLWELMREATKMGNRRQTRGGVFNHPRLERNVGEAVRNTRGWGESGGDIPK